MQPTAWRAVLPAVVATSVLFGGALTGAIRTSVAPLPRQSADLDAWGRVLADPRFHEAAVFTVVLAVIATAVSVALALPIAALLRDRRGVQVLVTLPVLLPHLLVAVVVVLWLGPGGLVDRFIADGPQVVRAPSGLGIVLVYVLKEVPFLVLLLLAVWNDDVEQRVEMAATLGVGPLRALHRVVWPAVRAPLVLGATVVMAFVLGFLQVPAVVGPTDPVTVPVYAVEVTRVRGLAGQADAAVALLLASGFALLLAGLAAVVTRRLDGVRR